MGSSDALEDATSRLTRALQDLEDAVIRNLRQEEAIEDLREQVRSMAVEHERLVASLEAERRRADRLEAVNGEASDRLDTMIDSMKVLLRTG